MNQIDKKKKRNNRRKKVRRERVLLMMLGVSVCVFLLLLCGKIIGASEDQNELSETAIVESTEGRDAEDLSGEANSKTRVLENNDSTIVNNEQGKLALSTSAYLDVKWINQNPELPTGCEITSLTTVLQYYGYSVSKTTMARTYLEKGYGSFFEHFVGDPFSEMGYGCMAQPITDAANKYFTANKISATAQNISGTEFMNLLNYVSVGDPVIVWNTMYMEEPYEAEGWYADGEYITWIAPEHCVVLMGYDLDKNVVYVSDPLEGIKTRNLTLFAEYYEAIYSQAVVIQ